MAGLERGRIKRSSWERGQLAGKLAAKGCGGLVPGLVEKTERAGSRGLLGRTQVQILSFALVVERQGGKGPPRFPKPSDGVPPP
jgi:hypothetical protein